MIQSINYLISSVLSCFGFHPSCNAMMQNYVHISSYDYQIFHYLFEAWALFYCYMSQSVYLLNHFINLTWLMRDYRGTIGTTLNHCKYQYTWIPGSLFFYISQYLLFFFTLPSESITISFVKTYYNLKKKRQLAILQSRILNNDLLSYQRLLIPDGF